MKKEINMENQIESTNQNGIIHHIEVISKAVKGQNKGLEEITIPSGSLTIVNQFLTVNDLQSVLYSIIFILSFEKTTIEIKDIADFVGISNLKVVQYMKELESLKKRGLVRFVKRIDRFTRANMVTIHDISFFVTQSVTSAILENNRELIKPDVKVDMVTLLESIYALIELRATEEITFEDLTNESRQILDYNKNLPIVRALNSFNLLHEDLILLIYLCRETVNGSNEVDLSQACEKIYDNASTRFRIRRSIAKKHSKLIVSEIIKVRDGLFRSDREILLTDKSLELLFDEDMSILKRNNEEDSQTIEYQTIKSTQLFFDEKTEKQLHELSNIISESNYSKIKNRLKKSKLPAGMNILFYGPPGTGKTASSLYQAFLAKRNIKMVDISETKSMWFGESEKIIKRVFEDYKKLVQKEKVTPILLFNECDAVFGTRKHVGSSPVDQTENAIQNIILQQMEDMDGILIATTNLTSNLDPAFERRFLYKILFPNPSVDVRSKIWNSKIKFLTKSQANEIAGRYEFTGGNIENIYKKIAMNEVITGNTADYNQIVEYCENELLSNSQNKKVGFNY